MARWIPATRSQGSAVLACEFFRALAKVVVVCVVTRCAVLAWIGTAKVIIDLENVIMRL